MFYLIFSIIAYKYSPTQKTQKWCSKNHFSNFIFPYACKEKKKKL